MKTAELKLAQWHDGPSRLVFWDHQSGKQRMIVVRNDGIVDKVDDAGVQITKQVNHGT